MLKHPQNIRGIKGICGRSTGTRAVPRYFSGGPQAEQTAVPISAAVQIETLNALAGQQVTYSETGLPPGLTMSSAGLITGAPTTAGSYQVTAGTASPAPLLPFSFSFPLHVNALAGALEVPY